MCRVIGEGAYYVPREEDVGQVLFCECTPKRGGEGAEQEQGLVVETGPEGTFSDGEAAGGGKKKKTKGEGPVVEKGPEKWPFGGRHAEAAKRGAPGEKVRVHNPFMKICSFSLGLHLRHFRAFMEICMHALTWCFSTGAAHDTAFCQCPCWRLCACERAS